MNTEKGWVKFYREWLDNPIITKDSEHLAVWTYLFVKAIHTEKDSIFRGKQITLKAGQLLALQKDICEILKIEPTKLRRILKMLKSAELIDYQTDNHKTLITLVVWGFYQGEFAEQNAELMPNQCRTKQETENEKEKRSKREEDKEKEIDKNERMEEVCVNAHTKENILVLGRYKNVFVDSDFYEEFKEKYWYYDKVIDKLSAYKQTRGIANKDDRPYLEQFAMPQWARINKVLDGKYPAYLQKLTWQYVNITCIRFFAIRNIFSSKTAKHIRSQIGEIV